MYSISCSVPGASPLQRISKRITSEFGMATSMAIARPCCSHGISITSGRTRVPALGRSQAWAGDLGEGLRGGGFENGRGSSTWALGGGFHTRILGYSSRAVAAQRRTTIVAEEKLDVFRAAGFIVKAGKNALDAGTDLVPDNIPRSTARAIVGIVGVSVVTWIFRALFSTALFILAIAGFSYLAYMYVSKDSDSGSGGGGGGGSSRNSGDSLDEARRIMDKYK